MERKKVQTSNRNGVNNNTNDVVVLADFCGASMPDVKTAAYLSIKIQLTRYDCYSDRYCVPAYPVVTFRKMTDE